MESQKRQEDINGNICLNYFYTLNNYSGWDRPNCLKVKNEKNT